VFLIHHAQQEEVLLTFGKRGVAAAAVAVCAATAPMLTTEVAQANVSSTPVYNSNAEAGYFNQSANGIRFRDVRTSFTVTQAMEKLNNGGTLNGSSDGGAGVQLCNNSTGFAVQWGILPGATPGQFTLDYQTGVLSNGTGPATIHDACVTGGVLPSPILAPVLSWNTVSVGDTVTFEAYYNQHTGWVRLLVSDSSQGGQESFGINVGKYREFTEPGVGVRDVDASTLSAPADITLAQFTNTNVTQYNGVHGALGSPKHPDWVTRAGNYNTGGSATDAPADLLQTGTMNSAGNAFTILVGNPAS
jgi:hypothetical protein